MALDRNALLDSVKCLTCGGASYSDALIIALLQLIVEQTLGVFSNIVGTGSPVGVVTPAGIGQFYTDATNAPLPVLWQATGLTNADWLQLT